MSEDKEPASSAPAPKFSRYKSVRHASAKPMHSEPLPGKQLENGDAITRTKSMARYRRSKADVKPMPILVSDSLPPLPTIALRPQPQSPVQPVHPSGGRAPTKRVTEPIPSTQQQQQRLRRSPEPEKVFTKQAQSLPQPQSRPRETENERLRRKVLEFRERENKKAKLEEQRLKAEEEERVTQLKKAQAETEARQARVKEEEAARLLAEQKRKDLERLEATLEAAAPITPKVASPREKFSFFSRKRANTKSTTSPKTAGSGRDSTRTTSFMSKNTERTLPPKSEKVATAPKPDGPPQLERKTIKPDAPAIEQGGGGIVPQTDAPISASNAGERRVLIRCKQSSINLPITPDTTPVDLVFSSANCMTQDIIPATAILRESYTQLGLERRVRRYEHIRDIMNSWDRDTQNYFLLENSESPKHDNDLETSSVPKEAPKGVTVNIYHSQKPGKWNKRYVTLLESGQIFMSKKSNAKPSDKDTINLCHLSDFDIYSSTPQQTRKVLKPPKKHCYAIKSQQKTNMFLSTENFVHYFSTDHEAVADQWYDAVQNWRSWYLVNRMGEGAKKKSKPAAKNNNLTLDLSIEATPYAIGSFTPLINLDRFGSSEPEDSDRGYDSDEGSQPRQVPFHLRNSVSLSPVQLQSRRESRRHPPPVSYRLPPEAEEEFSSSGLLGRTYSQRQKVQKEKEKEQRDISGQFSFGGFMDGPSLLNGNGNANGNRTMSMKSTRTRRDRPETSSGPPPGMPKPLLDFTPHFKEAPQWEKKGKGHGIKPVDGVPLIDVATTSEEAQNSLNFAPPTLFRRDQAYSQSASRPKTANKDAFVRGGLVSGSSIMNRGRVVYE